MQTIARIQIHRLLNQYKVTSYKIQAPLVYPKQIEE